MHLLAMEMVANEAARNSECLELDAEGALRATNEAEMFLRMGYGPDEIVMMENGRDLKAQYQCLLPISALCLREGRDRA